MTTQKAEKKDVVTITTAVGECSFKIPDDFPKTIFLDVYGKSYRIVADGRILEDDEILIKEGGIKK